MRKGESKAPSFCVRSSGEWQRTRQRGGQGIMHLV